MHVIDGDDELTQLSIKQALDLLQCYTEWVPAADQHLVHQISRLSEAAALELGCNVGIEHRPVSHDGAVIGTMIRVEVVTP